MTYGTPEQPDPQCISSVKGTEYYRENRIATISVKENELFFDPDETKINVKVDGKAREQKLFTVSSLYSMQDTSMS